MRISHSIVLLLCAGCAPLGSRAHISSAVPYGLEPELLSHATRTYAVFYEGNPIGEYVHSIHAETVAGRQVVRINRTFGTPQGPVQQLALFDARTLEPIRSESRGAITVDLQYVGGQVRGSVGSADNVTRTINEPLPAGGLLPYMFEAVMAVSPLHSGYAEEFQVVNPASAKIETVGLRVLGEETVTVPAGSFSVYKVELTGFEPSIVYVRRTKPHILIKQDLPSSVSLQLARETESNR